MQVTLSQLERGVIFLVVTAGATWGGSEEALLTGAEMYRVLHLAEFENTKIANPSATQRKYDLSPAVVKHIIATITGGPIRMPFNHALAVEPAIRRLRAALDKLPKPETVEPSKR